MIIYKSERRCHQFEYLFPSYPKTLRRTKLSHYTNLSRRIWEKKGPTEEEQKKNNQLSLRMFYFLRSYCYFSERIKQNPPDLGSKTLGQRTKDNKLSLWTTRTHIMVLFLFRGHYFGQVLLLDYPRAVYNKHTDSVFTFLIEWSILLLFGTILDGWRLQGHVKVETLIDRNTYCLTIFTQHLISF